MKLSTNQNYIDLWTRQFQWGREQSRTSQSSGQLVWYRREENPCRWHEWGGLATAERFGHPSHWQRTRSWTGREDSRLPPLYCVVWSPYRTLRSQLDVNDGGRQVVSVEWRVDRGGRELFQISHFHIYISSLLKVWGSEHKFHHGSGMSKC